MKKSVLFFFLAAVFLVLGLNYKNRDVDLTAGIFSIVLEILGFIFLLVCVRGFLKVIHSKWPSKKLSEGEWKPWKDYLWLVLSFLFLLISGYAVYYGVYEAPIAPFVGNPEIVFGGFSLIISFMIFLGALNTVLIKRSRMGLNNRKPILYSFFVFVFVMLIFYIWYYIDKV